MKQVSHFVGLRGVGGVQKNFIEYLKDVKIRPSKFKHVIYTLGGIDIEYNYKFEILDIKKPSNLYLLIKDLVSKKVIVHFYNNLSSAKVAFLLFFLPVCKLIIHERGTVWNQPVKKGYITRFNAKKSSIILSNSKATKNMLIKKFLIPRCKITVIHNGINLCSHTLKSKSNSNNGIFNLGFIGRLDSPKGVHVLIKAMEHLKEYSIKLLIAGDGPLSDNLKKLSKNNNIVFLGRIKDQYAFFGKVDLLVVPSIREPLGNVCIEAGLAGTPVLATNIDGIPEIITHNISGELVVPTDRVFFEEDPNMAPLPEYVINPQTQELQAPAQLNAFELSNKILELSKDNEKLNKYSFNLKKIVIEKFSIKKYNSTLELIYADLHDQ